MTTYMAKKEDAKRGWVVIDVKDKILGRAATTIANVLRGKDRPTYTPHTDSGDFVIVINAALVKMTGNKMKDKMYHNHSGYMGGLRSVSAEKLQEKKPEDIIVRAVKGMLPRNYLNKKILGKLKVYAGTEHPHTAQTPREVKIN